MVVVVVVVAVVVMVMITITTTTTNLLSTEIGAAGTNCTSTFISLLE